MLSSSINIKKQTIQSHHVNENFIFSKSPNNRGIEVTLWNQIYFIFIAKLSMRTRESFDMKMVLNKIRYYTFNICKRFYDKPLDHFTIYNSARQFPKRLYRFMFSECHIYVTYYLNFDHIIGHTIFLNIPWSLVWENMKIEFVLYLIRNVYFIY